MARNQIDGDQVQDETITEADVLDGTLLKKDLSLSVFDHASQTKTASETFSGGQFQQYDIMTFSVSEANSKFRLNIDFLWGHNSASNDGRFQLWLDGSQYGEEIRVEPKDAGTDQRIQQNLLAYVENLSVGNHTIELRVRPASSNRQTRVYRSISEAWRV